jgi:hypothetical protein
LIQTINVETDYLILERHVINEQQMEYYDNALFTVKQLLDQNVEMER